MTKYNMLPDEFEAMQRKGDQLAGNVREAGKDAGEAIEQSSETWHDNAPLDAARLAGELASKQLREVQDILENTTVVKSIVSKDVVAIGKKVRILIGDDQEKNIIVGGHQTMIDGRVSYSAPLVKPLLGKEVGDIEEVRFGGKVVDVEILAIDDGIEL